MFPFIKFEETIKRKIGHCTYRELPGPSLSTPIWSRNYLWSVEDNYPYTSARMIGSREEVQQAHPDIDTLDTIAFPNADTDEDEDVNFENTNEQ